MPMRRVCSSASRAASEPEGTGPEVVPGVVLGAGGTTEIEKPGVAVGVGAWVGVAEGVPVAGDCGEVFGAVVGCEGACWD